MPIPTLPNITAGEATTIASAVDADLGILHIPENTQDTDSPTLFTRLIQQMRHVMALLAGATQGKVMAKDNPAALAVVAYPMEYRIGVVDYSFAGNANFACDASQTNYLYLDADAALEKSTSGWPGTDHVKLAIVVCGALAITSIKDVRARNYQVGVVSNWWTLPPGTDVDLLGKGFLNIGWLELNHSTELTLAADAITITQSHHRIDTQGDAASDDLVTVSNIMSSLDSGRLLLLHGENSGRVVTVKSTGNIKLLNGDYVMDDVDKFILLCWHGASTEWVEICRSYLSISQLSANLDVNEFDLDDIRQLNLGSPDQPAIASGAIAFVRTRTEITNESGAASDDLTDITGGAFGDVLFLRPRTAGQVPTLKPGTGANKILLPNGKDFVMSDTNHWAILFKLANEWMAMRSHWKLADLLDPDKSIRFIREIYIPGTLTINTTYKPRIYVPEDVTQLYIAATVGTAPAGSACIVDLLDDAASIFASEGEMANIAAGTTQALSATKAGPVVGGSYLSFRTGTSVGSGTPAADLTVTVMGRVGIL